METEVLITKLKKGDASAQRWLYDHYAPKLYAVCLRYMHDEPQAQDCLQDGFILIFQHMAALQEHGALEGWMKRIVVNTCLASLRKKRPAVMDLEEVAGDEAAMLDSEAISAMTVDELLLLIKALPSGQREVFNLFAIEGYGHGEISVMLGISEVNSKVRLNRARKTLQEQTELLGIRSRVRNDVKP